ncbi:MAG: hypothetical protein J3R72DRAFT_479292 [Linnemannia gamsii]|nr:MAG: hypothetical protein J3R72DRAFT_479292 [Linnemannia gamsii]
MVKTWRPSSRIRIHPTTNRSESTVSTNQRRLQERRLCFPDSMGLISHDERAQTYNAPWQGRDVVVKKCDHWNERPVAQKLKHEARIYQVLRTLQGRCIPTLRIAAVADGMEMVLVTDIVGCDVSRRDYNTILLYFICISFIAAFLAFRPQISQDFFPGKGSSPPIRYGTGNAPATY